MRKAISVFIAFLLVTVTALTASADSIEVDFGDIAGVAGDVDVDTYVSSSDMVALRKILLSVLTAQSKRTADVNADGTINILDLVRLKKIMSDTEKMYYAEGITTVAGNPNDKTGWIYRLNGSGLCVREAEIRLGDGNNTVTIAQLSDFHFFGMNDADLADSVLSQTYAARKNSFGNAEQKARDVMKFAGLYDKTVVTGDVTDFLSQGSLELMQNVFGETGALAAVGNHEFRKKWFGDYTDTEPLAERYALLQQYWPNNIYYHSEVLNDKVMLIVLNNGSGSSFDQYYAEAFSYNGSSGTMDTFLAADLATAKEKGYGVLIFQHCPISTGVESDRYTAPLTYSYADLGSSSTSDFYSGRVGNRSSDTAVDKAVYKLITENAALIKGVFDGHMHTHFYTEIKAKSSPEAAGFDSVIPQYTLTANPYSAGNVIKITVKY